MAFGEYFSNDWMLERNSTVFWKLFQYRTFWRLFWFSGMALLPGASPCRWSLLPKSKSNRTFATYWTTLRGGRDYMGPLTGHGTSYFEPVLHGWTISRTERYLAADLATFRGLRDYTDPPAECCSRVHCASMYSSQIDTVLYALCFSLPTAWSFDQSEQNSSNMNPWSAIIVLYNVRPYEGIYFHIFFTVYIGTAIIIIIIK